MKEWNYDTLNGLVWGKLSDVEQLSILEKHYPIGMYIECNYIGNVDKSIITGYEHMDSGGVFIYIKGFYASLHPCYIKHDLQRNRLEKLKKLGIL